MAKSIANPPTWADTLRDVRFRVLGPVEVHTDDGRVLTLPRRQERCLLAVLLLHAGQPVPSDRLCALLWPDNPPQQPYRVLRTQIARIRSMLTDAGGGVPLVSRQRGYLLGADPDSIDAHRFRRLVDSATRATDLPERERMLRDALAEWHGPALHRAATDDLRLRLCADLDELRLRATEELFATGLQLGRDRDLLPELARLAAAPPVRERLVELHMRTLYRQGRTVEALDVYRDARSRLREDLGLDPGPALQQLQRTVLRGEPLAAPSPAPGSAAPVRPAQLPPDQPSFVGRLSQLDSLDQLVAEHPAVAGRTVVVSAIAGTAGVGKTALAVHWAHRTRHRYPDGQLYVNLRGYAPAPRLRPIDALAGFLAALGVPADRVPADLDQATALYRSMLADRRMLVLLDNAAGVDQVRPLLPAARGCVALVTSRDRLGGLVARDGAHPVTLGVLTADEAHALLAGVLGADRVAAEPDAAAELARLCAHLPLALRIVAADLSGQPDRRIADHVDALRSDDRLSTMSVPGDDDTAVRAAFDLSYRTLPPPARRLFRRLGLVPGADVSVAAAAALAGTTPTQEMSTVDGLVAAHLLTEPAPGRYTCHDLLRRYATERVRDDDSAAERAAATRRLYDHYTATVDAAVDLLKPGVVRLAREPVDPAANPVSFDDRAQALAWMDAERPNLVAAVIAAADHGPRAGAWHLADAMRGYFWLHIALPDWLPVAQAGLTAAEAGGDAPAHAAMRLNLADALARQDRCRDAIPHYRLALDLYGRSGDAEGEAAVANNLAIAHGSLGEPRQAAGYLERALLIRRQLGQQLNEASALLNLAYVNYPAGQVAAAADYAAQAVALYEQTGSRQGLGIALCSLGGARHTLGHPDEARHLLDRALLISREVGDRNCEFAALSLLAALYRDTGRYDDALAHARDAGVVAEQAAGRRLEADADVALGTVYQRMGRTAEAIDHLRRALALAREIESPAAEGEALLGLGAAYFDARDVDEALRCAEAAHAAAQRAGHLLREGHALTLLAQVGLALGQPDQAVEHAGTALKIHAAVPYPLAESQARATLADALRLQER